MYLCKNMYVCIIYICIYIVNNPNIKIIEQWNPNIKIN